MSKQPEKSEEEIKKLGQMIEQLLPRIRALKIVVTMLLADKWGQDTDGPIEARKKLTEGTFEAFNQPGKAAMVLSEEIASIVHDAARFASGPSGNDTGMNPKSPAGPPMTFGKNARSGGVPPHRLLPVG